MKTLLLYFYTFLTIIVGSLSIFFYDTADLFQKAAEYFDNKADELERG